MARDKEKHRDYMRDYMKRRREDAVARGLCPRCCKRIPEQGMICCSQCLDDRYKYGWK